MDFHGLARRQLQALCKANKIPANMTNVAMADALSALDNVEGIEEVMQQQSPEKADSGSPEVPRTVTRTSTRARKPPVSVNVLESSGIASLSRGGRTSRNVSLVDDDKVGDEKKDVAKTPAVAGSKVRAPAAMSRKKADVPSVQKVYSTRRSVRMVEKQLSELCLGESTERTQPIKIDIELSSEVSETDVKGENLAEVESNAAAEVVVETVAEEYMMSQIISDKVCEDVTMELDVDHEKGITTDGELDSVAVAEESNFKTSADNGEVMKMETQAIMLDSVPQQSVSNKDMFEDSTEDVNGQEEVLDICDPKLVTVEKKQDVGSPASEETTGLVKDSPPETENTGKENTQEYFKVPKKPLEHMSMGELRKLLKGMNISNTGNKDNKADANKHQDTPRPARHALETLPCNTQV